MMLMRKALPILSYTIFVVVVLGATIFYSPSWGLMDDSQNLSAIQNIQTPFDSLRLFGEKVFGDLKAGGIFRPIYHLWVVTAYPIFQNFPLGLYLLIAALNFAALPVWGLVFYKLFGVRKENFYLTVFLFPLSFFLFTPFWNIFTYISLQEKFVVWFGAFSLYFLARAYERNRPGDLVLSFLFVIFGFLSKPTAFSLPLAFFVFALCDVLFFKSNRQLSLKVLLTSLVINMGYVIFTFTVQLRGGYVAKYEEGLKGGMLLGKILGASMIVKGLFLFAGLAFLFWLVRSFSKKRKHNPLAIVIPLSLFFYLTVLAPWGFQSYLLCALAPFILGIFFPVYDWFQNRKKIWPTAVNGIFIMLLGVVLVAVILPAISRMGDMGKAVHFMKQFASQKGSARYFLPPPYTEPVYALNFQTGEEIVYLNDGRLTQEMLSKEQPNFLLVNNLAPKAQLQDAIVGREMFANPTWKVLEVEPAQGKNADVNIEFPRNLVQKLKMWIRDF